MTKLDVLIKARKLLSDPRRWRKGAYVQPDAEVDGGFCYCAVGALEAASGCYELNPDTGDYRFRSGGNRDGFREAHAALKAAVPGGRYVESFNDLSTTTYEDVLKLFSDAIQAEVNAPQAEVAAEPGVVVVNLAVAA